MGDAAKNRLPGGFRVRIAAEQGTGTAGTPALPDLTEDPLDWGNAWTLLPNPVDNVTVNDGTKFEDFEPAFYLHKTETDLVSVGVDDISWDMKETDLTALATGMRTGLAGTDGGSPGPGYDTLDQPLANEDFPVYQIVLERVGPNGGVQLFHFPRCKRVLKGFIKTAKGKISTVTVQFDVLAMDKPDVYPNGTDAFPEGATWKAYQRKALTA
jgi:hypothetical protein